MGLLNQISAGMVQEADGGRRVFRHGLLVAKRRVFVTADEERRLRRAYEWGVLATIAAITLTGPFTPFWFRLAVVLPLALVAQEGLLRRMTAALPLAPAPERAVGASQIVAAAAAGEKLLWFQLAFFVSFLALCSSSVISYEDLGWRKYAGMTIGAAMIAQVSYQLLMLRRKEASK